MSTNQEMITKTQIIGSHMKCPNCKVEVRFTSSKWWASDCKCGVWSMSMVAHLEVEL